MSFRSTLRLSLKQIHTFFIWKCWKSLLWFRRKICWIKEYEQNNIRKPDETLNDIIFTKMIWKIALQNISYKIGVTLKKWHPRTYHQNATLMTLSFPKPLNAIDYILRIVLSFWMYLLSWNSEVIHNYNIKNSCDMNDQTWLWKFVCWFHHLF